MEIKGIDYEIGIYDLEGHFIDIIDSWEVLEKDFGILKQDLYHYVFAGNNTVKGFQVRLRDKSHLNSLVGKIGDVTGIYDNKNIKKPVAKYYKGRLLCVYDSMNQAEKLTGISLGAIFNSCSKNSKAKCFTFKYVE